MFLQFLSVLTWCFALYYGQLSCSYDENYTWLNVCYICSPDCDFNVFVSTIPDHTGMEVRAAIVSLWLSGLKLDTETRKLIASLGLRRRGSRAGKHKHQRRARSVSNAALVQTVTSHREFLLLSEFEELRCMLPDQRWHASERLSVFHLQTI